MAEAQDSRPSEMVLDVPGDPSCSGPGRQWLRPEVKKPVVRTQSPQEAQLSDNPFLHHEHVHKTNFSGDESGSWRWENVPCIMKVTLMDPAETPGQQRKRPCLSSEVNVGQILSLQALSRAEWLEVQVQDQVSGEVEFLSVVQNLGLPPQTYTLPRPSVTGCSMFRVWFPGGFPSVTECLRKCH